MRKELIELEERIMEQVSDIAEIRNKIEKIEDNLLGIIDNISDIAENNNCNKKIIITTKKPENQKQKKQQLNPMELILLKERILDIEDNYKRECINLKEKYNDAINDLIESDIWN